MGVVTLLKFAPTFLVLCLMTTYSKVFSKYPKDIPFVSLTKKIKNHLIHKDFALYYHNKI
jgi:predicted nucleic acid-binding protein